MMSGERADDLSSAELIVATRSLVLGHSLGEFRQTRGGRYNATCSKCGGRCFMTPQPLRYHGSPVEVPCVRGLKPLPGPPAG